MVMAMHPISVSMRMRPHINWCKHQRPFVDQFLLDFVGLLLQEYHVLFVVIHFYLLLGGASLDLAFGA